jgi:hypothetical protein
VRRSNSVVEEEDDDDEEEEEEEEEIRRAHDKRTLVGLVVVELRDKRKVDMNMDDMDKDEDRVDKERKAIIVSS